MYHRMFGTALRLAVVIAVVALGLAGCVAPDGQVYMVAPAVSAQSAQTEVEVDPEEANKEFIQRYFADFNEDWQAALEEYVADEVLKHHIDIFEAALPGYQLKAEEMLAEGNNVFVRTTLTGAHTGDLMGIPPTGKPVEISLALVYRIEDGKIVDHWMLADQLTLMQQIGVIPAP